MEGYGDYDGGGGYLAQNSPSGGGAKPKYARDDNKWSIIPVTVKSLESAQQAEPNAGYKIGDIDVSQVRLIGRLLQIDDSSASLCKFLVHDGTGTAQFDYYTEMSPNWEFVRESWQVGKYVDVIAALRSTGGVKTLQVLNVRIIEDSNHITRHFLECIYTHLYRTRGPLGGGVGAGMGVHAGAQFAGGFQSSVKAGGVMDDRAPSMGSEAEKVLQIYKDAMLMDPDNENGISIQDAIKRGKELGILATVVQHWTEKHMMDGHIYSTVDDEHFRST